MNTTLYFVLLIPAIIFLIGLYRMCSVCLSKDRTGQLTIRVGWSDYLIRASHSTDSNVLSVYRIENDFCYDEVLVESKKFEDYVLNLVQQTFDDSVPDKTINKRFLRKVYW